MVKLTECIAPSFYNVHSLIKKEKYTHYWLDGGRGSMKSSFIGIELPLKMMDDAEKGIMSNALAIRRVKDTLKDSVFEQIVWGINKLGVAHLWHIPEAKLKLTYIPTGQVILFRGMDDPTKIKSTKVSKGWIKYLWYEECDEIENMAKIRKVNQSIMRGGENFIIFYSYNPPKSARNWVNTEKLNHRNDTYRHSSTYLTAPKQWLGQQFIIEAEELKKSNELAYRHEYLGEVVGTGGSIFNNVTTRKITDEEINLFDKLNRAIDFGFATDPSAYTVSYFNKSKRTLYIFHEYYKVGASNQRLADAIKEENINNRLVYGDSAEPRTINELQMLGIKITGVKKGKDSVHNGIKWLQDLREIVIDSERCPNVAREFLGYEYEIDKDGNFKADYPDKNNHAIDSVRYGCVEYITSKTVKVMKRNSLF